MCVYSVCTCVSVCLCVCLQKLQNIDEKLPHLCSCSHIRCSRDNHIAVVVVAAAAVVAAVVGMAHVLVTVVAAGEGPAANE